MPTDPRARWALTLATLTATLSLAGAAEAKNRTALPLPKGFRTTPILEDGGRFNRPVMTIAGDGRMYFTTAGVLLRGPLGRSARETGWGAEFGDLGEVVQSSDPYVWIGWGSNDGKHSGWIGRSLWSRHGKLYKDKGPDSGHDRDGRLCGPQVDCFKFLVTGRIVCLSADGGQTSRPLRSITDSGSFAGLGVAGRIDRAHHQSW